MNEWIVDAAGRVRIRKIKIGRRLGDFLLFPSRCRSTEILMNKLTPLMRRALRPRLGAIAKLCECYLSISHGNSAPRPKSEWQEKCERDVLRT